MLSLLQFVVYVFGHIIPTTVQPRLSGPPLQRFATFLHHARAECRAHALDLNLSTRVQSTKSIRGRGGKFES